MKSILILAFVCGALLFGGCADNSLMTDEEYERTRTPAAHSPDPMGHMPQSPYASRPY